jgi:hypothetical protein
MKELYNKEGQGNQLILNELKVIGKVILDKIDHSLLDTTARILNKSTPYLHGVLLRPPQLVRLQQLLLQILLL